MTAGTYLANGGAMLRFLFLLAPVFLLAACTVSPDPCAGGGCDTGTPDGPVYGKDASGRLSVTASQAWPGRHTEPAALTPAELARACVALGSCLDPKDQPAALVGLCVLPDGAEERAIPSEQRNERRSWVLRQASLGGSCPALLGLETKRPNEIECQEDGCWWHSLSLSPPRVSCAGDVATLSLSDGRVIERDCSRAYQRCDARSPTGCTDRRPVACDASATDRCDGAIKLGCDHSGRVSFHDCARVEGGTCEEAADGSAKCVQPDAGKCTSGAASTCTADGKVSVCVAGDTQLVDCAALGFDRCDAGRCVR